MTTVNNCNLPEDLYYVVGKHVSPGATVTWSRSG